MEPAGRAVAVSMATTDMNIDRTIAREVFLFAKGWKDDVPGNTFIDRFANSLEPVLYCKPGVEDCFRVVVMLFHEFVKSEHDMFDVYRNTFFPMISRHGATDQKPYEVMMESMLGKLSLVKVVDLTAANISLD